MVLFRIVAGSFCYLFSFLSVISDDLSVVSHDVVLDDGAA